MPQADTIDQRLLMNQAEQQEVEAELRRRKQAQAEEQEEETESLRQAVVAKRQKQKKLALAMKDQAIPGGDISRFGLDTVKSKVSDYIIDAIPGVGLFRILKNFFSGKMIKVGFSRIFIIMFENAWPIFVVLAALTIITMIVYFFDPRNILKIIWETIKWFFNAFTGLKGWDAISAFRDLFSSAYKY